MSQNLSSVAVVIGALRVKIGGFAVLINCLLMMSLIVGSLCLVLV